MKNRIPPVIVLQLILLTLLITTGGCSKGSTKNKYSAATETPAQAPSCFLVGVMNHTQSSPEKGFGDSPGSAIRLNFGANNLEACKQVANGYCTGSATQGFVPSKLTLIYTTYTKEKSSIYFSIKPNCSIETSSGPAN